MQQFPDDLDPDIFFMFDKELIESKKWASLHQAGRSIYPVIACHQNKNGIAFPGEQVISALSGRSEKIVRNGIIALKSFPGFTVTPYITKRGRRSRKFTIAKPPTAKGRSFPFHKSLLKTGLWSHLRPTAQALYIVMRKFAFFDFNIYANEENIELNTDESSDIYKYREWELCEAEREVLCSYAGISHRSFLSAIQSLCKQHLVEKFDSEYNTYETFKIFVRPQGTHRRN